jgi:hypothetical protein
MLGTAMRGLGLALGPSATPRLEFQRDLRERLIEEARLIALRPKPPPRARRPRRPRGGGVRLAAIGIGFSLAGGGVVAAAHSFSLPARAAAPATKSSPPSSAPVGALPVQPGPSVVESPLPSALKPPALVHARAQPVTPPADASTKVGVQAPLTGPVASSLAVPTPTPPAALPTPEIQLTISPGFKSTHQPPPAPTWSPSWLFAPPSFELDPFATISPLR